MPMEQIIMLMEQLQLLSQVNCFIEYGSGVNLFFLLDKCYGLFTSVGGSYF